MDYSAITKATGAVATTMMDSKINDDMKEIFSDFKSNLKDTEYVKDIMHSIKEKHQDVVHARMQVTVAETECQSRWWRCY
jgi:hypothetical protein